MRKYSLHKILMLRYQKEWLAWTLKLEESITRGETLQMKWEWWIQFRLLHLCFPNRESPRKLVNQKKFCTRLAIQTSKMNEDETDVLELNYDHGMTGYAKWTAYGPQAQKQEPYADSVLGYGNENMDALNEWNRGLLVPQVNITLSASFHHPPCMQA